MRKSTIFDELDAVCAALHVARDMLLTQADKARGPRRRRLKNIESAVLDALGALARQGMTIDEWRDAAERTGAAI